MYTLYYSPGACSMAIHVVLNELNAPFSLENVSLSEGKNKSPEFLKINPRGNVPVLADDGHIIREGGAILVYLLDKHQSPMLPRSGKERATALEWLMFCNATLHPAYSRAFACMKIPDKAVQEKALDAAIANINRLWDDIEARLSQSKYLCGNECSAADILCTVIANWSGNFPAIKIGPNAKRLFKEVIARPAYQKALKTEQVEYKAAA